MLDLLRGARFADQPPAEIQASLRDDCVDHSSIRTMYRMLDQNGEARERRGDVNRSPLLAALG